MQFPDNKKNEKNTHICENYISTHTQYTHVLFTHIGIIPARSYTRRNGTFGEKKITKNTKTYTDTRDEILEKHNGQTEKKSYRIKC